MLMPPPRRGKNTIPFRSSATDLPMAACTRRRCDAVRGPYVASGRTVREWTKVGVAFPHSEGGGFNIELKAFPRDGKLVVLPSQAEERAEWGSEANGAATEAMRTTKPTAVKERSR
jgi:hypothetical protein